MGLSGHRRVPGLPPLLTRRARPNLILVACRWRIELTVFAIVTGGLIAGIRVFGTPAVLAGLAGVATAAAFASAWPRARQLGAAAAWSVITPHRVRTCFAQCWLYNSSGKIPAVLRATATPTGECVRVWCRAGISFRDIEAVGAELAATCWAANVVVTRSDRFAHLVYIDVIRRTARPSRASTWPSADEPGPWLPPGPDDEPDWSGRSGLSGDEDTWQAQ